MIESEAWKEFDFQCDGGACVIVEKTAGSVVIRDSKNPALPGLVFTMREYADFRRRVQGDTWFSTALQLVTSPARLARTGWRQITGQPLTG
jgi:Domain of unknown function (DUF397)